MSVFKEKRKRNKKNDANILFEANIRYERLASAYEGFEGYHAETCEQIRDAFQKALAQKNKPTIINIAINPSADRKAQVIFKNERRLLFVDIFSMRFYFIDEHFLLRIVLLVLFVHKFRNGKYFHSLQFQFLHR